MEIITTRYIIHRISLSEMVPQSSITCSKNDIHTTTSTTTKKYQFSTRRKLFTKFQCYINIMLFVICHHKTSQPTQSYQLCTITFFAKYNLFISHNMVVSKLYAVHVTISRSCNQCTRHVCVCVCCVCSCVVVSNVDDRIIHDIS